MFAGVLVLSVEPIGILGINMHGYPSTFTDIHGSPGIPVDLQGISNSWDSVCVTLGYLRAHVWEALGHHPVSPLKLSWRYIVVHLERFGVNLEAMA